jgi:hypothetical protein
VPDAGRLGPSRLVGSNGLSLGSQRTMPRHEAAIAAWDALLTAAIDGQVVQLRA